MSLFRWQHLDKEILKTRTGSYMYQETFLYTIDKMVRRSLGRDMDAKDSMLRS